MKYIIDDSRDLDDRDRLVINYMNSMSDEYGDDLLDYDCRADIFWALSSVRKTFVSQYPIKDGEKVLITGDKFGALTGALCEKAYKVDAIVPTRLHADAVSVRYRGRKNLHVIIREYDDWTLSEYYFYVFVNLEYSNDYSLEDTYEFDRLINPAIRHLDERGKLVITARGDKLHEIRKLLYKKGFSYQRIYDPLGNGALFMEGSRIDNLSEMEANEEATLINNKWVRKYGLPFMGGKLADQDMALIKNVMSVQIDLLRKLLFVCKEHNLTVYPVYGTLLGIIRDGGMIQGDDDIDVAMPREDYDKLISLSDNFSGKYFLQTPYNDDCFFGGYAKLRNQETTAISPQNWWTECSEGISIDIFPVDVTFLFGKEKRKCRRIRYLQRLLYAKAYGYFPRFKDMRMLEWKAYKYYGKLFTKEKIVSKMYKEMSNGDPSGSKLAIYCHYGNGRSDSVRYINKSDLKETVPLLYEGVLMQVPVGWNNLLRSFYGDGYLECQGFLERKMRHGFYDAGVPYTVYKKRFGGLKHPSRIKEPVVLFGDGSVFNACLKYYKDKVNVSHLVQLPGELPMKPVYGIPVEKWEDFEKINLNKSSYRAVICSGDVRMAETILRKVGYEDYYIFWHNRDWMLYANQTQVWKEIRELI